VNASAIKIQDDGDVVSDDFPQEEEIHYNDIGDLDVPVVQQDMDRELPLGVCMGITWMMRVGGRIGRGWIHE
jgi:hypothetical protein